MVSDPAAAARADTAMQKRAGSMAIVLIVLVAGASGCAPQPTQAPARAAVTAMPGARSAVPADRRLYELDAASSVLRVLVAPAGPMARFGHHHTLRATGLEGNAWIAPGGDPASAGFELVLPVAGFDVDATLDRAAVGGDHAGSVPEEARAGTYRNLQGAKVLNAADYPVIVIRSADQAGPTPAGAWRVAVVLRGMERVLEVPVALTIDGARAHARGQLTLLQSEFGMTPFAIAGGAVAVADAVSVRFELHFTFKRMT